MGNPQFVPVQEQFHPGGFLVSEARGHLSREQIVVTSGVKLLAGTVLGKLLNSTNAPTFTAQAGNTGNGAMGAIVASAGVIVGDYRLEIVLEATDAGVFEVYDPNGNHVGQGNVGSAFSGGGLEFTLADGDIDFIVGDGGKIAVAAHEHVGQYKAFDPTAVDGSQNAAAVLYAECDATNLAKAVTAIVRGAEVNISELVWGSGVTTSNQKTAALAQLAVNQIVGR